MCNLKIVSIDLQGAAKEYNQFYILKTCYTHGYGGYNSKVECGTFNTKVVGSSPTVLIINPNNYRAFRFLLLIVYILLKKDYTPHRSHPIIFSPIRLISSTVLFVCLYCLYNSIVFLFYYYQDKYVFIQREIGLYS